MSNSDDAKRKEAEMTHYSRMQDMSRFKYYSAIKTGFSHMNRTSKDIEASRDMISSSNMVSELEPIQSYL